MVYINFESLQRLDVSNSEIRQFNEDNIQLPNLRHLWLDGCNINEYFLTAHMENMELLSMENASIASLDSKNIILPTLETLLLRGSLISKLDIC